MTDIRRLMKEDRNLVQQIVEVFHSESATLGRMEDFLKNDLNYVVACIEDGRVVGFTLAYELQRYDKSNMMYVHEVDVLPEYRRKGIGKRMLGEVLRICEEKGLCKMFLITNKSNEPACSLYEATGGNKVDDDSVVYCYDSFKKVRLL